MTKKLQYEPPRFNDKELLEIFPESRKIVPLKIRECRWNIRKKEKEIQSRLDEISSLEADLFSESFGEELIKQFMMPELTALEKNLFRLRRLEYLLNPNKQRSRLFEFEEKIKIARRFPIEELARGRLDLRPAGKNFTAICPIHDDKNPSFYIYPETNSFYCFGCQESGDVIKLAMVLHGVDFRDAIAMLQN